jgi:hypothetical protein
LSWQQGRRLLVPVIPPDRRPAGSGNVLAAGGAGYIR